MCNNACDDFTDFEVDLPKTSLNILKTKQKSFLRKKNN